MSAPVFVRAAGGFVLLAVFSLPARAQGPSFDRNYAVLYGGVATTEVTAPTFGGSFGFSLTRDLQIFGELSRAQDAKTPFTVEDLALVDRSLTREGIPSNSSVKMAVNYYSGGLKYLIPLGPVRPYVSVTGGVAHMSPHPSFSMFGLDVTSEVMSEGMNTYFREETRPMAGLAGGVLLTAGHLVFDAGYKYSTIFIPTDFLQDPASPHSHTTINTHQFVGGVGFKF